MPFVSVTRLGIRKVAFLPGFAWYALLSGLQAHRAAGNLATETIKGKGLVFWTITVWSDSASARAFRNSVAHLKVMPKLAKWCDEATYVHWEQEGATTPNLQTAHARLLSEGIVSRVSHPSENHARRSFPAL